jgi:hypothetical protein
VLQPRLRSLSQLGACSSRGKFTKLSNKSIVCNRILKEAP